MKTNYLYKNTNIMAKKESTYYNRQIQKAGSFVKRPNEIIKRPYGDGDMKLTFKSPDFYDRDLVVTDKALLSQAQKQSITKEIDVTTSATTLDLSNTDTIVLNVTTESTITEISNFDNGKTYKIFVVQDEIGGYSLNIDDSLDYLTVFGDLSVDTSANSVTILEFVCSNDKVYVESDGQYNKIIQIPTESLTFTIDTTLGSNAGSSYKLQTKPDYESITKGEQYTFNYDFIVDWGDGTSDHITSAEQPENNHIYSTNGQYTITITGLCEAFGFSYFDVKDVENGFISPENLINYISSMDYEKITIVDNLGNIGLKDASFMFGGMMGSTNITSVYTSNWDVSNVTDMSGMFSNCSSLTTINVSNWDVSNVTDMFGSSLSPNLNDNLSLNANLAQYTPGGAAEAGRTLLTDPVIDGGHAWSITDAGPTA